MPMPFHQTALIVRNGVGLWPRHNAFPHAGALALFTPFLLAPTLIIFSSSQIQDQPPVDFLRLYIPSNVFYSLSNALVPAVVVFSILLGVALIQVPGKQRMLDVRSVFGEALMRVTGFVGRLASHGVFASWFIGAGVDVADGPLIAGLCRGARGHAAVGLFRRLAQGRPRRGYRRRPVSLLDARPDRRDPTAALVHRV